MLGELFAPELAVAAVEADATAWEAPLRAEEAACLGPDASPARRREFAAGRACARAALEALGRPVGAIGRRADRSPEWPPGVVGSISHCRDYCAAALATRGLVAGLGFDAERSGRVGERLLARFADERERGQLSRLGDGLDWATMLFSAKESAFKCWRAAGHGASAPTVMRVELDPGQRSFRAWGPGPGPELVGRFAARDDLLLTAAVLAA